MPTKFRVPLLMLIRPRIDRVKLLEPFYRVTITRYSLIIDWSKVLLHILAQAALWLRAAHKWRTISLLCALLLFGLLLTGCAPRGGTAQAATSATDTPQAQATQPASQPATATPGAANATRTPATGPSSEPPDPMRQFNTFSYFIAPELLIRRDALQLDKDPTDEMLYTLSIPAEVITEPTSSVLRVIDYDSGARRWNPVWTSELITGTASPLPAANRSDGFNGGKLLHTDDPILLLRTTTIDGHAHLHLWKWNAAERKGEALKMTPLSGGADQPASFEGDLDVNVGDLDNDGVYEVIVDNVAGVQVWKWDGARFVGEGKR